MILVQRYRDLIEANQDVIATKVTENFYDRHIAPVFLGRNKVSHHHEEFAIRSKATSALGLNE
jgi:hypothetical protein